MSIFAQIKQNWRSGITVALVSIPLSISLAVASQSTPTAGIITAIWAGLVASLCGGSKYNIVGPTGALSGILAAYALTHGTSALPMLAITTGLLILVAFTFKLERFLVFVPASTIHGFTLGVAVIIAANQGNFALGLTGLKTHEHFIANVWETIINIGHFSVATAVVCAATLTLLFVFAKYLPKIPGAIILSPIGILIGYLASKNILPLHLQTLGEKFSEISPTIFQAPSFTLNTSLLTTAITVALVAILETMISAKIADGMTGTKHDKQKEMLGLGLANIASGLMGGIPATAALARTSLNIKTGAESRMSATISSIAIALISLILLVAFKYIPLAFIAAILIFVAVRMVERQHFLRMWKADKTAFGFAVIVAVATIVIDPIVGILTGTAVALLVFVEKLSHGQFIAEEISPTLESNRHKAQIKNNEGTVYSIKGPLVYINAAAHIARLETLPSECKTVILRLREVSFIDSDGVEAFDEMIQILKEKHKEVYVSGATHIEKSLYESKEFNELKQRHHIMEKTEDIIKK